MVASTIALWATPRTASTAFERMMIERGDVRVVNEPWSHFYYYSADGPSDRFDEVLPGAVEQGLVDQVDAFCEGIAFSPAQVARVFEAAALFKLPVKLHAEQLSDLGGATMLNRASVRTSASDATSSASSSEPRCLSANAVIRG